MSTIWYKIDGYSDAIKRVTVVKETPHFVTYEYGWMANGRETTSTSRVAKDKSFYRTWAEARQYLRERALKRLNSAEEAVMHALNHQVKINMIPEEEPA